MPNIGTRMPNASALTWLAVEPGDADDRAGRGRATTCTASATVIGALDRSRRRAAGEQVQVGDADLVGPRPLERADVGPQGRRRRRPRTAPSTRRRSATCAGTLVAQRDADGHGDDEHRGADDVDADECASTARVASLMRRSSCQRAERSAQPLGEHVVGELGHGPLARRRAHRARASAGRRAARSNAAATSSASSGRRTTMPVSPSATASAAPPTVAGHLRHAARRRLDEHDAEALLLEPAPPVAAQHGVHVGAAVQRAAGRRWRPGRGTAPARAARSARRAQPALVAAAAGDGQHAARAAIGAASAAARIAVSKPLRGTSRLMPTTSSASTGRPKCAPRLRALGRRSSGWKRSMSTPGRHDRDRQRAAGRALGLGGRVAAGGDRCGGRCAARAPSACLLTGQPAGHGDLGAVQHDVVRQLAATGRPARAAPPGRARSRSAPTSRGHRVDAAHHPRVRQQHRLAGALDVERLRGVELGRAARTGW